MQCLHHPSCCGLRRRLLVQTIDYWPFVAATLGLLCFLLGCAILAVNCGWTAIRAFQPGNG